MTAACQCLYETASVAFAVDSESVGPLRCAVCGLPKLRALPAERLADFGELSARIGVPELKLRQLCSAGVLRPVPKLTGHRTKLFHVPSALLQLGIKPLKP